MSFAKINNFIRPEVADYLVACANYIKPQKNPNDYWEGMATYVNEFTMQEAKDYLYELSTNMLLHTMKTFKVIKPLFRETIVVGTWQEGKYLTPHRDNEIYSGQEDLATPWRDFTAVTYLNDDYEGGELILPDYRYQAKPRKGECAIFPADTLHGVSEITKGCRYTVVTWMTYDHTHQMDIPRFTVRGVKANSGGG